MKKLTLNETWRLCLSMWRWIAKMKRNGSVCSVLELKEIWLIKHGFGLGDIYLGCFFCEEGHHADIGRCVNCPGRKVDQTFDCRYFEYNFQDKPIQFYNKLVSLNRKRLK